MAVNSIIKETCDLYRLDMTSVQKIAHDFNGELDLALAGEKSSLRILPSFLSRPSGEEKGHYIAIDFGGSNVRVMLVMLQGQGHYEIIRQKGQPLQDPEGRYDHTTADSSGREIFGFVADLIAEVMAEASADKLGLTFSYPMQQNSIYSASLIRWTKELKPRYTVGRDIGIMLDDALINRGIKLKPAAIINDTVAVFLAAAYSDSAVCAGSICGTGHNTCYLEPSRRTASRQPMIVNSEAGNFSLLADNRYDQILDQFSDEPGQQRMEKMVSGKYLGELLRITLQDLGERGYLEGYDPSLAIWKQAFTLPTEVLGWLQADGSREKQLLNHWLENNGFYLDRENIKPLKLISKAILERAMKLIAGTYIAILKRGRTNHNRRQLIAVDGALFKHVPGFMSGVENIMQSELADRSVSLVFITDGSNIGAAVAAALAEASPRLS